MFWWVTRLWENKTYITYWNLVITYPTMESSGRLNSHDIEVHPCLVLEGYKLTFTTNISRRPTHVILITVLPSIAANR